MVCRSKPLEEYKITFLAQLIFSNFYFGKGNSEAFILEIRQITKGKIIKLPYTDSHSREDITSG